MNDIIAKCRIAIDAYDDDNKDTIQSAYIQIESLAQDLEI